ncbi:GDP-mannose 4,6-dehydratase [Vibrio ostreicida]|uniref:GDP-mannose 4,6-dehydratase n=1 Tax=Vibrio ostreicida TaxID=526588 RepID=UPI0009705D70|nr:GDP-mannose 4,6-dehydratase [Vibrio ostreicida]
MKTALIFGASGQDGVFLSKLLKLKGYFVYGVSRKPNRSSSNTSVDVWLDWNYRDQHDLKCLTDWKCVNEIYVLSGQSSVGRSFDDPSETVLSFLVPLTLILDIVRLYNPEIRLYNACSSEVFGQTSHFGASENEQMSPVSPYGLAKKTTAELVRMYRNVYGLYAVNGFLFNHESNIRPDSFLSRKLVLAARSVKSGQTDKVYLGTLDYIRDWGWAEDYVVPMNLMLNQADPEDFIISSGVGHSLLDLAKGIFDYYELDFLEYYELKSDFVRKNDIQVSIGDPSKAAKLLGWKAKYNFEQIIAKLVSSDEV